MNRQYSDEIAEKIMSRVFDDCTVKHDGTLKGLRKDIAEIVYTGLQRGVSNETCTPFPVGGRQPMDNDKTQSSPPEYGAATGSAPRPSSDTFLEMAAEIIDPVEWVALQMTKSPVKPGMTRGEAMDLVKAVVREGFEMLKRQEAQNK